MSLTHVIVHLESDIATSYRCTRAADALDIDVHAKSTHHLDIDGIDLDTPFALGVIVGASGSGKTTLAHQMFGADCFVAHLDLTRPIIDQFPAAWSYEDCAKALGGMGLTSVPCWIRPAYTLSNGQRVRAEAALALAHASVNINDTAIVALDEWTSVVDRTVAKVMSHCIAKYARATGRRIILCTCHYDVLEWLDPDFIIDCNVATYVDRRLLPPVERQRTEHLTFDIRRVERRTWNAFAKYHYLSAHLPGGHIETFGLFHQNTQIGFQCFANYVPHRKVAAVGGARVRGIEKMHSNRTVIHPDYAGFGLGIRLINETSALMAHEGYDIWATFSSAPVYRAMSRDPKWVSTGTTRRLGTFVKTGNITRTSDSFRKNVTMYGFHYVGPRTPPDTLEEGAS
jgi:ABC-type taurine transport system ATPase subunit